MPRHPGGEQHHGRRQLLRRFEREKTVVDHANDVQLGPHLLLQASMVVNGPISLTQAPSGAIRLRGCQSAVRDSGGDDHQHADAGGVSPFKS